MIRKLIFIGIIVLLIGCTVKDEKPKSSLEMESNENRVLECTLSFSLHDESEDIPALSVVEISEEENEFVYFHQRTEIENYQSVASKEEYEQMLSIQKRTLEERQGYQFDYQINESQLSQELTVYPSETKLSEGDLKEMGIMEDFDSMQKRLELDGYQCQSPS